MGNRRGAPNPKIGILRFKVQEMGHGERLTGNEKMETGGRNPETGWPVTSCFQIGSRHEFKIKSSRFKIGEGRAASGKKTWFGVLGTW
jgi:hypothetical protein